MYGRCVECGAEIDWRDLFTRPRCDGLVEHARGVRQWAWWGARTFASMLWPARFWSRVLARHELKLFRAAAWFALPLVLSLIPAVCRALYTFVAETIHYWEMSGPEWAIRWGFNQSYSYVRDALPRPAWWFWPFVAMVFAGAVVMVCFRRGHRRVELSEAPVTRWLFYGLAMIVFVWPIGDWFYRLVGVVEGAVVPRDSDVAVYVEVMRQWELDRVFVPSVLGAWLLVWNWYAIKRGVRVGWPVVAWIVVTGVMVLVGANVLLWMEGRWWVWVFWVLGV